MIDHIAMVYAAGGLTASEKHLLGAYCNHTDAHGYCWPGVPRLADETGMSERTVKRVNAALKTKKLIKSVRRFSPKTGDQITNLTRVNLGLLAAMKRPPRTYDDNLVEAITFEGLDDVETPSDLLGCQYDTPPGANMTPPRGQSVTPRGDNLTPQPSPQPSVETSVTNSSSSVSDQPPPARDGERGREEEGGASGQTSQALTLVDRAAACWTRRPNAEERERLAVAVAQALAAGASSSAVMHGLTRDLETARNPIAVVTSRTRVDGWAGHDPAALAAETARPKLPPRCDDPRHDPLAADSIRILFDEEGRGLGQCPRCSVRREES